MRNRWWILGTGLLLALLTVSSGLRFLAGPAVDDGTLEVNGRIEGDEITVASKVAGLVVEMKVREGDQVQRDGLIARISSEQIQARLEEAEARWRTAIEEVQEASIQVKVQEKEVARAEAARAARAEAKATLADTRIHAPLSSTVVTKVTDPGEYVVPGTPIVVLVDLKALHLKTYVKETEIGKVKLGDPGRVLVDAFPGRPFRARVSEISPEAEFTPKSVDIKEERVKLVFGVKLAVENPEGYLKPGMPADGQILWKPGVSWGDHPVQGISR